MVEIPCPIAAMAQKDPHRTALITPSCPYSYQQLNFAIAHLVRQLSKEHISAGSRVAFLAQPSLPTILLFFALFRLRAIACPLSFRIPHAQLSTILQQM